MKQFLSNIFSELVAGVILLSIPVVLTYFFKTWFWENILPLLVAFLTAIISLVLMYFFRTLIRANFILLLLSFLVGSILTTSFGFIFFQNSTLACPPKPIPESPQELIKWSHQFPNEIHINKAAKGTYYGHCVQWELFVKKYYYEQIGSIEGTTVKSIISSEPPMRVYCFFREEKPEISRLSQDKKFLFKGTVQMIRKDFVRLDRCEILEFP